MANKYRRPEPSIDGVELAEEGNAPSSAFGCRLACSEVSYWVRTRSARCSAKQLLHGVSMWCNPGECVAIMGPSGAGKSTLLDLLACRKNEGLRHGDVTLNGYPLPTEPSQQAALRRNVGYVLQGDVHWPHLTVRESVTFATALRMHGNAHDDAIHTARVALVLNLLRLNEIADVRVGSSDRSNSENVGDARGSRRQAITDGEMKRLSVALEMASLPTLLFCDEPTTGLDSPTAYDVMRSIVELAGGDGENNNSNEAGMPQAPRRTVCVTVHQPSEPVFALFTRVLILAANGRTVFFGPPANVVPYFTGTTLGYVIDEGANPADFAITIAGGGLIAEGAKQPASPVALAEAWRHALADPNNSLVARRPPSSSLPPHEQAAAALPASPTAAAGVTAAAEDATLHDLLSGQSLSDFPPQDRQFELLLRRAWLATLRRRDLAWAQAVKAIIIGLVVGLIYHEVFAHPGAPWVNLNDAACDLGGSASEKACLVEVPRYSSANVTCTWVPTISDSATTAKTDPMVSGGGLCMGSARANYGAPWLDETIAANPSCSLAPLFLARNQSDTFGEACAFAGLSLGSGDACRVVSTGYGTESACVALSGMGLRLSPDALNACSVFFLAVLFSVMSNLQEVPRLFETRRLVLREVTAGSYEVRPLWAAQALALLPLQLSAFAVFFNLAYWLIGIPIGEAGANYWYCLMLLLATNAVGLAYAQLLAAVAPSAEWALALFPGSFLFLANFSGFTLLVTDIPVGWRWARYLSFVRWAYEGLVTQVFSTIQGGDGVIAYWGFEGVDPMPPLLVLFLDFAILNLLTLLCMRQKRSKLVVVDSFTTNNSGSSSSSSSGGFPSIRSANAEEGSGDEETNKLPSTGRRFTWQLALWQALGGELGTNSDDCAPSLVERLLGPMVDDADLEFFHAKAQERSQQQRQSEGGADDDAAASQLHEVDERGFTAKDRAAEHLAAMHPIDITGGGRSSFFENKDDNEDDDDTNSISSDRDSIDRGSMIWSSSSRSSRSSRAHKYSFSPDSGAEQSTGATLLFRDLRFSVPKAKAETPMEQWSQKCASWLVGRDGGSYDRLEHLKEKDQEEGGVSPMWVPPNDSSNSGGGGDSVTSPNSGLSGNSTVEEGEPASPGSGNGSPLSSPSSAQNNHKELLGGVSGQALPGELLLVMGPSGAGKTTLLQILSGHKRAGSGLASGSVHVNGHARQASDGRWRWTGNQPTCSDSGSNGRSSSSTVSASPMHEGMTEHPSKPPITALPSWAYVSQDHDVHVGVLTVRETIEFAVALRLTLPEASGAMSQGAKAQLRRNRAALLLDLLGLTALEHVLVGGSSSSNSGGGRGSGLSGGETKRVTIAVELVNLPALIFMDEPTSGLDALAAYEVSRAVRLLADQGRTLVVTMHQPSVTTFGLGDSLLLLSQGRLAYYGPLKQAVKHFHRTVGIPYRPGTNPADFLVAAVASRSGTELSAIFHNCPLGEKLDQALGGPSGQQAQESGDGRHSSASTTSTSTAAYTELASSFCVKWFPARWVALWVRLRRRIPHPSTFPEQVRALVGRQTLFALREPRGLFGVGVRHIAVGAFFGTLYRVDAANARSPQNVASLLFFCVFFMVVGHQHSIPVLVGQRQLWRHERGLSLYSTRALYVSALITKWPVHLFLVFLFSLVVYPSCGLAAGFDSFAYFYVILSLVSITSLSLCELVATVAPSSQAAVAAYLPMALVLVAFGGYVVLIPSLPSSIMAVPDLSFVRWAFQGLLANQYPGDAKVLDLYGFAGVDRTDSICPMVLALVVCESAKFMALRAL